MSLRNIVPMFYLLLCTSFSANSGNVANDDRFSLQMKHRARDKTLGQCFTYGIEGDMPKSAESELKQTNPTPLINNNIKVQLRP